MCLLLFFFLNNCVDLTSAGLNSASKGSGSQEVSYINKDDFSSFISFILFLFFAFVEKKQSTSEKKNFGNCHYRRTSKFAMTTIYEESL